MRIRETYRIRGLVQGVGFRPTVWHTARRLALAGFVFNDAEGVIIAVEGDETVVHSFEAELRRDVAAEAPLARIDAVELIATEPPQGAADFVITESRAGRARTMVTPDAATCPACEKDVFDPANRRYRYAFTNCTHCGPRFTITRHIPYDRAQTSMSTFPMCPACRREYENPADRRFHAQPNACPVCGPRVFLTDPAGRELPGDAIAETLRVIRAGGIAAVKGLGGFHLVCDAANESAVAELRRRKNRSEKAFAVMCANAASARELAQFSDAGATALTSVARPIVLAPKTARCEALIAPSVAPLYAEIGVMLPYTPVHLLLFFEALGRPAGGLPEAACDTVFVMTSANPGGEPLVIDNDEALARLAGIADVFLMNDRPIVARCDDSVVRDMAGVVRCVRRARGFTPLAVNVPEGPDVLAWGPYLKTTACVTRGREAFLTEHIGDTDNAATCAALVKSADHLLDILEVTPAGVACDAHPDFFSTHEAERTAADRSIPLAAVQHHHAHIAAAAGEHGLSNVPVWGLAMDGTGLGDDGAAWGGELLHVFPDGTFRRAGHLKEMPLPGFDKAAREPRRMGAAMCLAADRDDVIETLWPAFQGRPIREVIRSPRLSGRTTSLGRLFDAASAILGFVEVMKDEAYAAVRLESAAFGRTGRVIDGAWAVENGVIDFAPLFAHLIRCRLAEDFDAPQCAADFQATVAEGLALWAHDLITDDAPVCLAGGSFLNRTLSTRLPARLRALGHAVYLPEALPPGDGAVSFGEALVARARMIHQGV